MPAEGEGVARELVGSGEGVAPFDSIFKSSLGPNAISEKVRKRRTLLTFFTDESYLRKLDGLWPLSVKQMDPRFRTD